MKDLVKRDGLYYKKFTDVPFTGKVTGKTQGSLTKGKWNGPWVRYYYNGQLWEKGNYKNGKENGPWVRYYYKKERLKSKEIYKNGKRDGSWVHYYDNGQLKSKGNYKNGKQDGPWVYYTRDGFPYTRIYKNGVNLNVQVSD